MKHKLIMENWRRFVEEVEEEEEEQVGAASDAAKALVVGKDKGLHDYTALLKQIASDDDFKKLALQGRLDGDREDEVLKITKGTPVRAKDLIPTQKDIDTGKSLGDQMTNKYDAVRYALEDPVVMPSPGGRIPLLVFDNKYILDGHHRWSQVLMTNPDGIMTVNNLTHQSLNGREGAEVALKATQLAIAGLAGNVVTKATKINLLKLPKEQMGEYVKKNITDEVLKLLTAAGKISKPDREQAAQYYMKNLAAVQAAEPGAFDRVKGMPQADDSGAPQANVNHVLSKGMVNWNDPKLSDLDSKK